METNQVATQAAAPTEQELFESAYIAEYGDPSSVGVDIGFAWHSSAGMMWRKGRATLSNVAEVSRHDAAAHCPAPPVEHSPADAKVGGLSDSDIDFIASHMGTRAKLKGVRMNDFARAIERHIATGGQSTWKHHTGQVASQDNPV